MKAIILLVIFLIGIQGCYKLNNTYGRDFSIDQVKEFKIGTTTQEEIIGVIGNPYMIQTKNDTLSWVYSFGSTKAHRTSRDISTESKFLCLTFDNKLILSKVTWTFTKIPKIEFGLEYIKSIYSY